MLCNVSYTYGTYCENQTKFSKGNINYEEKDNDQNSKDIENNIYHYFAHQDY